MLFLIDARWFFVLIGYTRVISAGARQCPGAEEGGSRGQGLRPGQEYRHASGLIVVPFQ